MANHHTPTSSPLKGGWLLATLAVLLGAACMVALGAWQLGRLQGRRAANALVIARMNEPALILDGRTLDVEADNLRRAVVRGTYDYDQEMILRNRTFDEVPGVHVLVPLRIAGSEVVVLVDRGWIPFEFAERERRAVFQNQTGEVEVRGVLRQSQSRRSSLSPADPPLGPGRPRLDAWFRVDLPRIQEQVPYHLLPLFLEEETPPGATARWLPRPDPDIQLDEGSHLVYAVQWFAFAGMLILGYAFFFHTRTRSRAKYDD